MTHNGQTQSQTTVMSSGALVGLSKAIEDVRQKIRIDSLSAISHDYFSRCEFTRSMRNPGLTWDDMAEIKKEWGGPFLIKGVLTAEDARHALDVGADGVVVSNHGGRQLDNCVATIDALPEIVEAVGHSLVVLIDGGFRRGADIVKALALGAKGVLLGRATLYGLAAGGQPGVAKSLAILREEVDRVFALLGCSEVSELTGNHVTVVTRVN